jgi:hypothetical protein
MHNEFRSKTYSILYTAFILNYCCVDQNSDSNLNLNCSTNNNTFQVGEKKNDS